MIKKNDENRYRSTKPTVAIDNETDHGTGKIVTPNFVGDSNEQTIALPCCSKQQNITITLNRTLVLRLVFLLSLLSAGIVCSLVSYFVITDLEKEVGERTYESVVESALNGAQAITLKKFQIAQAMAEVVSQANPDAETWPQAFLPGFIASANRIAELSSPTSRLALMALVTPEQAPGFEAWAQNTAFPHSGYPNTTGWSDFGFGIYGIDESKSEHEDNRFHDITGESLSNKHSVMAPFIHHSSGNPSLPLRNVIFGPVRTRLIDAMIDCSLQAAENATNITEAPQAQESPKCAGLSDFTELIVVDGPAAILFHPVYPVNDPMTMTGIIGTSVNWQEVLTNVVPDYVDGLVCVISTDNQSYSYTIDGGIPALMGDGDKHDPKFSGYGYSVVLNDVEQNHLGSSLYTLTIYPSDATFAEFQTSIPLYVALGFVGVMLFCAILFFLYDFFMKYESHRRRQVLEAKRRFVRFISHEIRTPLNTVCMGLELLQGDLRRAQLEKKKNENTTTTQDSVVSTTRTNENTTKEPSYKIESKENEFATLYWLDLAGDIWENTKNAVAVLNDLLNYDKIESGTLKLEVSEVPIWELMHKVVDEFQIQAKNKRITLNYKAVFQADSSLSGADPSGTINADSYAGEENLRQLQVIGDDMRLRQVARNLISNALKFTEEDGDVHVMATYIPNGLPGSKPPESGDGPPCAYPKSGSIRISVKDSGAGMSPEQLSQLFAEGVQFDANKLQAGGGSGLGLSITKGIVEGHGGTIEVRSDGYKMGTTFVVELPLFIVPLGVPQMVAVNQEAETLTEDSGGDRPKMHRVLVVEDSASNRKMLVRLIERAGHICVTACNGQEAVEAYVVDRAEKESDPSHFTFDTILMDNQMPVLDGPSACKKIRDLGCTARILGVTGNVLSEDVAHFKAMGADEVFGKPVNFSLLEHYWITNW